MKGQGYFFEDLFPGMEAVYEKRLAPDDIAAFADLTGDRNPLHLDEDFARGTRYRSRIAHGMLTASLISTVLVTQLPGPGSIYVSQSLRFLRPVRCGDLVTAAAEVTALHSQRRRVTLACRCLVGRSIVVEGEAVVQVPSRHCAA